LRTCDRYLRWFDIGNVTQCADWVNLTTYDLHGSWDSPEDDIGSFVYAHTNLTEISAALDLLWRNSVPANKVNLGLGFYGRSYTLSDPSCSSPGCPFSDPGSLLFALSFSIFKFLCGLGSCLARETS
jgi:chitinase